jgi:hypothetical protein
MLGLLVIAGMASGTFYSLTLTFVIDRPSEAFDHICLELEGAIQNANRKASCTTRAEASLREAPT